MKQTRVKKATEQVIAAEHRRRQQTRETEELFADVAANLRKTHPQEAEQQIANFLGIDLDSLASIRRKSQQALPKALKQIHRSMTRHNKGKRNKQNTLALASLLPPPKADDPPNFPVCFFPADSCDPPGRSVCDASQAAIYLSHYSSGLGGWLGIDAFPEVQTVTGSLFYGFMPPFGGSLAVIAEILVAGEMLLITETDSPLLDLLWSVEADARLTFRVSVHQSGIIQSKEETVASLHCGAGSVRGRIFRDDLFVVTHYAQILENEPVTIQVSADLYARGRSEWGKALLAFQQIWGGIRIPELCLYLTPNMIL